ncbi:MAG: hypothetical protein AAGC44_00050 [Planctomycetota bacterium]
MLRRVEQVSSLAWVDRVSLGGLDREQGVATIRPRPGQRDIARFVGPRQCERLAGELTKLLGRPMRVELASPTQQDHSPSTDPAGARPGPSQADRQRAIGLPLVKDVLDAFPDAQFLDARPEQSESPPDNETKEPGTG